ncbi:negative elongation factor b [Lichtheimia corymbifera JMRC:FSU:9682]|uniref:Negative elongation factor b n=1 Tax=Lichtheimia corymbifera JMRC:FSU:9682 TaxID=1263082 RepID=A0A068RU59_9FUNG|nr:negative elongation factor b [Lichtheimia corymbifera JMRC:FSU:9682]
MALEPSPDTLQQRIAESPNLEQAINDIQRDYSLSILPGMEAIYPLLDISGCTRLQIHTACLQAINNAAVTRILSPDFGLADFERVFDKAMSYIDYPELQTIPMTLLRKFVSDIKQETLDQLKDNPKVFQNCPLKIKQRIWKQDEAFFQSQVLELLNEYHHDEDLQRLAMNLRPDSYQELLTERRNHPHMQKMMQIINGDPKLYNMFIKTLKIVFESTPYPSLCSIRVDILMNYHDNDFSEIYDEDPCHQLIWSLDTCVRTQNMDEVIIEKIKECFDDVSNGTPLYTDFAMVIMDPAISNFLSQCVVKWLRTSVDEGAPENLEQLINYNAKLLNLAEHAPMAAKTHQKIPKLDKDLRSRFWNAMCRTIVEENNPRATIGAHESEVITDMLQKSEIARKSFVHYCTDRAYEGDVATLQRCLPFVLASLPSSSATDTNDYSTAVHIFTYESFIDTFINILAKKWLLNCIKDPQWRQPVMDNFLLQVVRWNTLAHKQVVLLLAECFLHAKFLNQLNEKVALIAEWADYACEHGAKDSKHMEELHNAYESLLTRSETVQEGQFRIAPPTVKQFVRGHL